MTGKVNKFCIQGGHVLLPSGETQETDIVISEGRIDAIGVSPAKTVKRIDASGCMVLPGIVDLHGDAFERQIMPRPGVTFPLELSFLDTDRQLVANGMIETPSDATMGMKNLIKHPLNIEGLPRAPHRRAPTLGEHTQEILEEIGYSQEEITRLQRKGAVQ